MRKQGQNPYIGRNLKPRSIRTQEYYTPTMKTPKEKLRGKQQKCRPTPTGEKVKTQKNQKITSQLDLS